MEVIKVREIIWRRPVVIIKIFWILPQFWFLYLFAGRYLYDDTKAIVPYRSLPKKELIIFSIKALIVTFALFVCVRGFFEHALREYRFVIFLSGFIFFGALFKPLGTKEYHAQYESYLRYRKD
jgi:hypothetical protein